MYAHVYYTHIYVSICIYAYDKFYWYKGCIAHNLQIKMKYTIYLKFHTANSHRTVLLVGWTLESVGKL